jgi:hypothetical protein
MISHVVARGRRRQIRKKSKRSGRMATKIRSHPHHPQNQRPYQSGLQRKKILGKVCPMKGWAFLNRFQTAAIFKKTPARLLITREVFYICPIKNGFAHEKERRIH